MQSVIIPNEPQMLSFAAELARSLSKGSVIFLYGDLGAGKTTLVRGILQHFGHQGAVKSPTYTLVEPYQFSTQEIYHFDLYRLGDPEELEYIGGRDYFDSDAICLVEWPEKASGYLPEANISIFISYHANGRKITVVQ